MTDTDRIDYIRQRRAEKAHMTQVAFELGISRERVRQLCITNDIPTTDPYELKPPLRCQNCGDPYRPPRAASREREAYESAPAHLKRTGHHVRPIRHREWQVTARQAEILARRDEGMTISQIMNAVHGQRTFVSLTLQRAGRAGSRNPERDALIIEAWKKGTTRASLVETFGLSKERLRQIITSYLGSGEMPREATSRRKA